MTRIDWLQSESAAFRLMIATSWLAPDQWRTNQDQAIREAIDASPDWREYLSLVGRHGTPGLSWAALRRVAGITIPEAAAEELRQRSDDCRKRAMVCCLVLADVLKRFNRAGIPVMPLKGQLLSYELYRDFGLRLSRDVDVEVPEEELAKAQGCLEGNDWRLESSFFPMSPRQRQSFLENEQHINFVHSATGCVLELHWRSQWETRKETASLWERSVDSVWQGHSIRTMHPGDLALYLCSHGGLHEWFRAKWLGDLARAHSMGLLDWETSMQHARSLGQERVLLAGLQLLEWAFGLTTPELPGAERLGRRSLIETPLLKLQDRSEPEDRLGLAKFRNRIRRSRHERLLWPRKAWRESLSELFYSREDFRTIRLPDSLFWAYMPLRPFLWGWRLMRRPSAKGS